MSTIPFASDQDVTATAGASKIPQAGSDGKLSSAWSDLFTSIPAGAGFLFGFIGNPLVNIPSGIFALGYDQSDDQVKVCIGDSIWRTFS